jgi:glutamyl/glutaminyl-tRNA synthetase
MQISFDTAKQALTASIADLDASDFESEELLKFKFEKIIADLNLKNGQVLWPLRVALTNEQFSPGVFEVCFAYGYEKTIKRLTEALKYLS